MNQSDIDLLNKYLEATTKTKKHASYQIIHNRIIQLMGEIKYPLNSKYEEERFEYILNYVKIKNKTVLDVGFNTGYFLFEMVDSGAKRIIGYEGGEYHYKFVEHAVKLLKLENKIKVVNSIFDFYNYSGNYDIMLLLNILHHLGDEFDSNRIDMISAKNKMIEIINRMSNITDILIFQMGFNWKGDINSCLFKNGTKAEMIDFILAGTDNYWEPISIGIADGNRTNVTYNDLNEQNIKRDDSLGEFLNRPIFIFGKK